MEKLQEMVSQRFLVRLGVENNMQNVCQSPTIRKLLGWGGGQKKGFRVLIRMNNYLPDKKIAV